MNTLELFQAALGIKKPWFIKDVAFRHVDDRQESHIQISAKEPHFNRLAVTEPDARRTMRKNARGATLLLPAQATLKSTSAESKL